MESLSLIFFYHTLFIYFCCLIFVKNKVDFFVFYNILELSIINKVVETNKVIRVIEKSIINRVVGNVQIN